VQCAAGCVRCSLSVLLLLLLLHGLLLPKLKRGAQWQEGGVAALRLPVFIVESQVVWANSNRHLLPHVVTVAALNVQSASGAFHFYYGA